jgi:hypothetical protein
LEKKKALSSRILYNALAERPLWRRPNGSKVLYSIGIPNFPQSWRILQIYFPAMKMNQSRNSNQFAEQSLRRRVYSNR